MTAKATASPEIPKAPAVQALTLDKLPSLASRILASLTPLRLIVQEPERVVIDRALACQGITTAEQAADFGTDLVAIKRIRRAGETHYELLKKPFNAVRAYVLDWEREDIGRIDKAERRVDRFLNDWRNERRRIEAELQREKQRLADEEAQRERERQVEALKNVAAQQANPLVTEALVAEAESLAQAPVAAPYVAIETEVPDVPGLSFTKRYKIEIVGDADLLKFIKAVGAKKIPLKAALGICAAKDENGIARFGVYTSPWLNDQAKACDGDVRFAGCTVREVQGTTGR